MNGDLTAFTLAVSDADLDELHRRVRQARVPDDFANDDGGYGLPRAWVTDMLDYWSGDFDWRAQEARINAVPQFRVTLDDVPIHFQWVRGEGERTVPVILSHGWPWTFWDWNQVIGPLTHPAAHGISSEIAFDVVVPSLPGFGFSSPLRRPMGCRGVAELWNTLMRDVLGYDRYAAVGGDWGGKVTGELAQLYPEHVIGAYSTLQTIPGVTPSLDGADRFAPDERWMSEQMSAARPTVTSHLEVHRRDPQTLAYALNDSPVGLAAWIWERRRNWRDPDTLDDVAADRDFLCTTASIYWFTQTIGTSMRFYRDNFGERIPPPLPRSGPSPTPVGFGITPRDVLYMPRAEAQQHVNLVHWSLLPRGGHFSAYEIPHELASDIHAFVRPLV